CARAPDGGRWSCSSPISSTRRLRARSSARSRGSLDTTSCCAASSPIRSCRRPRRASPTRRPLSSSVSSRRRCAIRDRARSRRYFYDRTVARWPGSASGRAVSPDPPYYQYVEPQEGAGRQPHADLDEGRHVRRREESLDEPGAAEHEDDEQHHSHGLRAREAQRVAAAALAGTKDRPREAQTRAGREEDRRKLEEHVCGDEREQITRQPVGVNDREDRPEQRAVRHQEIKRERARGHTADEREDRDLDVVHDDEWPGYGPQAFRNAGPQLSVCEVVARLLRERVRRDLRERKPERERREREDGGDDECHAGPA